MTAPMQKPGDAARCGAVLLLLMSSTALAGESLDTKDDFRGVKCGSAPAEDMVKVTGNQSERLIYVKDPLGQYARSGDELRLGETPLSQVSYIFYDGKFLHGMMKVSGSDHVVPAADALTGLYGQPTGRIGKVGEEEFFAVVWTGKSIQITELPFPGGAWIRVECRSVEAQRVPEKPASIEKDL